MLEQTQLLILTSLQMLSWINRFGQ